MSTTYGALDVETNSNRKSKQSIYPSIILSIILSLSFIGLVFITTNSQIFSSNINEETLSTKTSIKSIKEIKTPIKYSTASGNYLNADGTWAETKAPAPAPCPGPTQGPGGYPTPAPGPAHGPKPGPCTYGPSEIPTNAPVNSPKTRSPISLPTFAPVNNPTYKPIFTPWSNPVASPTSAPVSDPTSAPIATPTSSPISDPTSDPTNAPVASPTSSPISDPTSDPTNAPVASPTSSPISDPTSEPTTAPTNAPISDPTYEPTFTPTISTKSPTKKPTRIAPTPAPNTIFVGGFTNDPTSEPTEEPTKSPLVIVNNPPTAEPSAEPTTCECVADFKGLIPETFADFVISNPVEFASYSYASFVTLDGTHYDGVKAYCIDYEQAVYAYKNYNESLIYPYNAVASDPSIAVHIDKRERLNQLAWFINNIDVGTEVATGPVSYEGVVYDDCSTITASDAQAFVWAIISDPATCSFPDHLCTESLYDINNCNIAYLIDKAFTAVPEGTLYDDSTDGVKNTPIVIVPDGTKQSDQVLLLSIPAQCTCTTN
eukprot:CAMPEP_0196767510 /NCGR_PEP_ID=MMETSP1095-20130614/41704_1 /TAXON_ID=96789 ORGANISM="Chromulina nebulosa, Strain UTEXLB2642" /NCGR_SAMPLE_ID=MMETSP1095 /ASSEMBLY_ACC=CAM_ASM_000446 /LENGTH=543 /DNA_ID=CAMNT_0042135929 /DNA_START=24 /DNA_END=1655 /DNA_ORIENTATION=-